MTFCRKIQGLEDVSHVCGNPDLDDVVTFQFLQNFLSHLPSKSIYNLKGWMIKRKMPPLPWTQNVMWMHIRRSEDVQEMLRVYT